MNSTEFEKHMMADNPEMQVMFIDRDLLKRGYIQPEDYFISLGDDRTSTLVHLLMDDGLFQAHGRVDGAILPVRLEAEPEDLDVEQADPDTMVLRLRYLHAPAPHLLRNTVVDLKRRQKQDRKAGRLEDAEKAQRLLDRVAPFLQATPGVPSWVPMPVLAKRHPEELTGPLAPATDEELQQQTANEMIELLASLTPLPQVEPEQLIVPDEETLAHLEQVDQLIVGDPNAEVTVEHIQPDPNVTSPITLTGPIQAAPAGLLDTLNELSAPITPERKAELAAELAGMVAMFKDPVKPE